MKIIVFGDWAIIIFHSEQQLAAFGAFIKEVKPAIANRLLALAGNFEVLFAPSPPAILTAPEPVA